MWMILRMGVCSVDIKRQFLGARIREEEEMKE
jgi:hypothetical protein